MTENLNLTELIEQLQQIVKDGRFEYTPTNVESVHYKNMTGAIVELNGLSTRERRELEREADDAESERCAAEEKLEEARSEIARLKKLLNQ